MGRYRNAVFRVNKAAGLVRARFAGPLFFHRSDAVHEPLDPSRVFAVDTESLLKAGRLTTLLVSVAASDGTRLIETPDGVGMLDHLLEWVVDRWGERYSAKRRSPPVLSVWFNLPYDFGRLVADRTSFLRFAAAGADQYSFTVSPRLGVRVRRMFFGSASSFDWIVRDRQNRRQVRLLAADLTGYWKTTLRKAARAMGVREKIDVEALVENVYSRTFESLTAEEWEVFKEYAIGDVQTTLELYFATVQQLVTLDPHVVKKDGLTPVSAPGAAAKIVFNKAFRSHPDLDEWFRYRAWADRLGCLAYAGGRTFCTRPGLYSGMGTLDLKSAYPYQTALLPDPCTVKTICVKPSEGFDVDWWRGKFGAVIIDGEGLDDLYPALRLRDHEKKRLRYIYGRFEGVPATIPEVVLGVVRGALRVTRVRKGCWLSGSPEHSFLRAGVRDFFEIKESPELGKPLKDMAKLLANSTYGKLVEVQVSNFFLGDALPMPHFAEHARIAESVVRTFADCGAPPGVLYFGEGAAADSARAYYKDHLAEVRSSFEERAIHAARIYIEALTWHRLPTSKPGLTTLGAFIRAHKTFKCGHYFMPMYAAQITGGTAASLGTMAACLGALQGDTDSVHVRLPLPGSSLPVESLGGGRGSGDGSVGFAAMPRAEDLPGFGRYFEIMEQAGYPAPRLVGGRWCGLEGMEQLGGWVEESSAPSEQSVLVRPKVYSHRFRVEGRGQGQGWEFKQAKHGFSKYHSPEVDAALKDTSIAAEERAERAYCVRAAALHEAMVQLYRGGVVEYETRPAPRKLRESVVSGKDAGEFISRIVRVASRPDPNTWTDRDGFVRWKPWGE